MHCALCSVLGAMYSVLGASCSVHCAVSKLGQNLGFIEYFYKVLVQYQKSVSTVPEKSRINGRLPEKSRINGRLNG